MHAPRRSLNPSLNHSFNNIAASIAVAAAIILVPAAQAQVAKVNGVAIPQTRMDVVLKMLAANKQPDTPENRTRIREQLINQEIVSQEAVKKGLDKNPEIPCASPHRSPD